MLDAKSSLSPLVEQLFRQIVAEMSDEPAASSQVPVDERNISEIVLDISIEGVRYTLTRSFTLPETSHIGLSPREKEIVRLVAKGMANKAIAAVLEVSPWTVATHLRRVYTKLSVGSRAEMIAKVLECRLLEEDTAS